MPEHSESFIQAMKDRMEVSYAKYGPIKDAYPHKVNAIESLQKRLDKYHETGNTEWLVDAANFAMIEFMLPSHPKAHFRGTDSHESPGRFSLEDGMTAKANSQLESYGPLTVEQARQQHVCRICRKRADGPLILDYGREFAHTGCLSGQEVKPSPSV